MRSFVPGVIVMFDMHTVETILLLWDGQPKRVSKLIRSIPDLHRSSPPLGCLGSPVQRNLPLDERCLKKIYRNLGNNAIRALPAMLFRDLAALTHLYIQGNHLTSIGSQALTGLDALSTL